MIINYHAQQRYLLQLLYQNVGYKLQGGNQIVVNLIRFCLMNWDCSIVMRSSVHEQQSAVIHRFPRHKIKHSCGNLHTQHSSSKQKKVSLKRHGNQQEKSKELKKKTSLKSRNHSPISNTSYADFKSQYQSRYSKPVCPGFVSPPHYIHTSRAQHHYETETSQSASNIYYTEATYGRNTPNERNLFEQYRMPPRFNEASSSSYAKKTTTNCTPVMQNHYCQNQKPMISRIQKVTPMTTTNKTFGAASYGCKPGQIIIKQIKNPKPEIKIAKFNPVDSPNFKIQFTHTIKSLTKTNISQKKYERQDKQNIINRINPPRQFCIHDQKLKTEQQETKASNFLEPPKKKKRIQDFLTSRQQIKSIRDSDEWSENQQHSEIITTFREIIQEHGKFQLQE